MVKSEIKGIAGRRSLERVVPLTAIGKRSETGVWLIAINLTVSQIPLCRWGILCAALENRYDRGGFRTQL